MEDAEQIGEWVRADVWRMEALRRDHGVLTAWGRNVRPPDQYRWDLRPEMDYLDRPEADHQG